MGGCPPKHAKPRKTAQATVPQVQKSVCGIQCKKMFVEVLLGFLLRGLNPESTPQPFNPSRLHTYTRTHTWFMSCSLLTNLDTLLYTVEP